MGRVRAGLGGDGMSGLIGEILFDVGVCLVVGCIVWSVVDAFCSGGGE